MPPYPRASPKTATRIDGFFAKSDDQAAEGIIERKLAEKIEDPVHKFISKFDDPAWSIDEHQRRQMTRYIILLFNRCEARKEGTKHTQKIQAITLQRFLDDEVRLITVAAQWNIKALLGGKRLPGLITAHTVAVAAKRLMHYLQTDLAHQDAFVNLIVTALAGSHTPQADEAMIEGEWKVIRTDPNEPFIISDTPVVTWERLAHGFNFGIGFERANLEVIVPVSPLSCLYILPAVERMTTPIMPTIREVNIAQAAFSHRACFADRKSEEIDRLVQENIHKVKIGRNAFTLWHRKFDEVFYDTMMQQG